MYLPESYREEDGQRLARLIEEYPLGVLITVKDGVPVIGHIPFFLTHCDNVPLLVGHLARANPQWHDLRHNDKVQVIFTGPQAYVSPQWYCSPGVPTWNYAVVHVHGTARLVEDDQRVAEIIVQQEAFHEAKEGKKASTVIGQQHLDRIVGLEIAVERIIGKFKLSQSRSAEDRQGVITGLRSSRQAMSAKVAELIEQLPK